MGNMDIKYWLRLVVTTREGRQRCKNQPLQEGIIYAKSTTPQFPELQSKHPCHLDGGSIGGIPSNIFGDESILEEVVMLYEPDPYIRHERVRRHAAFNRDRKRLEREKDLLDKET